MSAFKIGDKVRVLGEYSNGWWDDSGLMKLTTGLVGVVTGIRTDNRIRVNFCDNRQYQEAVNKVSRQRYMIALNEWIYESTELALVSGKNLHVQELLK